MKQSFSIFNDVVGPVMTGPSSSHTAGPSRIGYLARHMLGSKPVSASFVFNEGGSFAASYNTQGTDRGLVGGLLGYRPDDIRMLTSLKNAEEAGLKYNFGVRQFESDHPNTVIIEAAGEAGDKTVVKGKSVGGGMIAVMEINGFKVSFNGKKDIVIVCGEENADKQKCRMLLETWITECDISETNSSYENVLRINKEFNEDASLCGICEASKQNVPASGSCKCPAFMLYASLRREPDKEEQDKLSRILSVEFSKAVYARVLPTVFPVKDIKDCEVPFHTAAEMLSWAEEKDYTPGEAGLYYEAAKGGISPDEVMKITESIVDVMEIGIRENLASNRPGRLIKACSGPYVKAADAGKLINLGAADKVIAYSMAMVERNSYYKTIVAAPTSGSCGTVPGTIMGAADFIGADRRKRCMAVLAAGAIGLIIAEEATFAAEVCGCQAECGSASAMAAAAAVELMNGSVREAQAAASIALQNVLGMICDSVANLVEVPCLGRNVLGGVNALAAANMVMAGEDCVIPLDETVQSMLEVGKLMPRQLCCTNSGGLAITKTSLELAEKIRKYGTTVEA